MEGVPTIQIVAFIVISFNVCIILLPIFISLFLIHIFKSNLDKKSKLIVFVSFLIHIYNLSGWIKYSCKLLIDFLFQWKGFLV